MAVLPFLLVDRQWCGGLDELVERFWPWTCQTQGEWCSCDLNAVGSEVLWYILLPFDHVVLCFLGDVVLFGVGDVDDVHLVEVGKVVFLGVFLISL